MRDQRDPEKLYEVIRDTKMKYGCTIVQAADTVEAWREQGFDPIDPPAPLTTNGAGPAPVSPSEAGPEKPPEPPDDLTSYP